MVKLIIFNKKPMGLKGILSEDPEAEELKKLMKVHPRTVKEVIAIQTETRPDVRLLKIKKFLASKEHPVRARLSLWADIETAAATLEKEQLKDLEVFLEKISPKLEAEALSYTLKIMLSETKGLPIGAKILEIKRIRKEFVNAPTNAKGSHLKKLDGMIDALERRKKAIEGKAGEAINPKIKLPQINEPTQSTPFVDTAKASETELIAWMLRSQMIQGELANAYNVPPDKITLQKLLEGTETAGKIKENRMGKTPLSKGTTRFLRSLRDLRKRK